MAYTAIEGIRRALNMGAMKAQAAPEPRLRALESRAAFLFQGPKLRVSFTQHFREHELKCACGACEYPGMDATFMHTLERIRHRFDGPMRLSSAYRCPDYNADVSKTGRDGPHTTGRSVDVLVSGRDAYRLLKIALSEGIDGVGVNQKGAHASRFIHLDDINLGSRPWVWSY